MTKIITGEQMGKFIDSLATIENLRLQFDGDKVFRHVKDETSKGKEQLVQKVVEEFNHRFSGAQSASEFKAYYPRPLPLGQQGVYEPQAYVVQYSFVRAQQLGIDLVSFGINSVEGKLGVELNSYQLLSGQHYTPRGLKRLAEIFPSSFPEKIDSLRQSNNYFVVSIEESPKVKSEEDNRIVSATLSRINEMLKQV